MGEEAAVVTTARLAMLPPAEERDAAVLALYNDEETMLPWLPFLCPMTAKKNAKRRATQRKEYREGSGLFLDLVDRETGELVGTSGFRTINYKAGEAEWGAVVRKDRQRTGLCWEAYSGCLEYLRRELRSKGIVNLTASTMPDNAPMVAFLTKAGLEKRGAHTFGGNQWIDFCRSIDTDG